MRIILILLLFVLASCSKYQEDRFVDVDNSETAFLVPLETSSESNKLTVADYDAMKVSAKRIKVPTRWHSTGYMYNSGDWIPTVRVLKVDRAPITRNWTGANSITVESSDSIDFSVGFNCTAEITDAQASTYLYKYPEKSLEQVMDSEIRNMVQQGVSTITAKYKMDELRAKKTEIVVGVRDAVIKHFSERGITITTLGMSTGFKYANQAIQNALDEIVVIQQEKETAKAKLDAVKDEVAREEQKKASLNKILIADEKAKAEIEIIKIEAEANRITLEAKAKAESIVLEATAEAKAILLKADAVSKGGNAYIQLKTLEVQQDQIEQWDGKLPQFGGSSGGMVKLLDVNALIKK